AAAIVDTGLALNASEVFNANAALTSTNAAFSGPRPYIDVTAPPYAADPTGSIDSTAAIQAAITAACSLSPTAVGRPGVYFPPGQYHVTQTQTGASTTAPIFTTCGDLYLYSNGSQSTGIQFRAAPEGAAINVSPGASPNAAPVFLFQQQSNVTVEDLAMSCYNECIWSYASTGMRFKNDALAVPVTGLPGNSPLRLSNGFWFWITGGTLETFGTGSGSVPTLLFTGEAPLGAEQPLIGLLNVSDVVTTGGGFEYSQNVASGTSQSGTWDFHNITQENPAMAFLTIAESTPGNLVNGAGPANVLLDTVSQSDMVGGTSGFLVYMNTQAGQLLNYRVINSAGQMFYGASSSGNPGTNYGGLNWGGGGVIDSTGALLGTQLLDGVESHGYDFQSRAIDPNTPSTKPQACSGYASACVHGVPALRFFSNGLPSSSYSTLGLDASEGILLGGGNALGYTATVTQSSPGGVTISSAQLMPPTNFTGSATTGGSLSAGTYYGALWTADGLGAACWTDTHVRSVPSYAGAVTVGGANNAINFTWTGPQAAPAS